MISIMVMVETIEDDPSKMSKIRKARNQFCPCCRPKGWKPPRKDDDSDSELEELTEAELAELEAKEKEIEMAELSKSTNLLSLATTDQAEKRRVDPRFAHDDEAGYSGK